MAPRMHQLIPVLVLLTPGLAFAQKQLSPLYALPSDGTWVEFTWERTTPQNKKIPGTLRISSVGKKMVQDHPCRWVEIKLETPQGDKTTLKIRKLLVDETTFTKTGSLVQSVREGYHREDGTQGVTRLAPGQIKEFLTMGLSDADAALKEVGAREAIKTPLGTYQTRHLVSTLEPGKRVQEYHVWLTPTVPFGWAKLEIRDRTDPNKPSRIFVGEAAKTGKNARSEVDETTVK